MTGNNETRASSLSRQIAIDDNVTLLHLQKQRLCSHHTQILLFSSSFFFPNLIYRIGCPRCVKTRFLVVLYFTLKKTILSWKSQIIRFLTCLNKAKVTLMAPKRSSEQSSMRKREGKKKNHTKIRIEWDVCLSFCFIFIIAFLPPSKKGSGMPVIISSPLYNPLVLLSHKYIH